jgi:hypothetical protein
MTLNTVNLKVIELFLALIRGTCGFKNSHEVKSTLGKSLSCRKKLIRV